MLNLDNYFLKNNKLPNNYDNYLVDILFKNIMLKNKFNRKIIKLDRYMNTIELKEWLNYFIYYKFSKKTTFKCGQFSLPPKFQSINAFYNNQRLCFHQLENIILNNNLIKNLNNNKNHYLIFNVDTVEKTKTNKYINLVKSIKNKHFYNNLGLEIKQLNDKKYKIVKNNDVMINTIINDINNKLGTVQGQLNFTNLNITNDSLLQDINNNEINLKYIQNLSTKNKINISNKILEECCVYRYFIVVVLIPNCDFKIFTFISKGNISQKALITNCYKFNSFVNLNLISV